MSVHWLWPLAAAASFVLTWLVTRLAERHRLLDVPNERSLHDRPVPRGGGIAIVVTFLAGSFVVALLFTPEPPLLAAIAGGGLVAAIGLVDDYREVSVGRRLVVHTVAALWAVYWMGGLPEGLLPGVPTPLVSALGILCSVWLINLFNFMDGIDGIASIETMTVCAGGIVLYLVVPSGSMPWVYPAMLLASVTGFLAWNFPAARVFLGDAGSGFLGFMMALFCIQAAHLSPGLFWGWIVLLGVFIADTGVTLARRIWRRERLSVPHRSHAYQFAARKLGSHAPVSLAAGAINLFGLLPIALLVATARIPVAAGLLIAYVPLVLLAIRLKAGASVGARIAGE